MFASPYRVALLAAAVLALLPSSGKAQKAPGVPGDLFTDNYNFQLFEPFDLDLDNLPVRDKSGYFFRYDKLYWAPSSERTTIGFKGETAVSEVIYRTSPFSEGTPPVTYTVINDIQDAAPHSEFGWGDRYEFGYTDERGVTLHIGIMNGPSSLSQETYGFDPPTDATGAPILDSLGEPIGSRFGFGSVHVNFRSSDPNVTAAQLLLGFRDYGITGDIDTDDDAVDGPIEFVLVGPGFNENEGFIDAPQFPNVPDGEADNLDGDRVGGVFFVTDVLGNVIGFGYDFDDLHNFNIRFEQITARSVAETQGIELMKTFQLDNRHKLRRQQHNRLNIGYGFRLFRFKDQFSIDGSTDLFGRTFAETDSDNQLIGPQIRAQYTQHRGAWTFDIDSRFMAAVNFQDVGLVGGIGEDAIPGGPNQSAVLQPTFTAVGRRDEAFSPLIELRLNARYNISQSLALRAGYTAMFVDNVTRSSQLIGYTLPNYTLNATGEQQIFLNGLNFGIEGQY